MSRARVDWAAVVLPSFLAALTTWVALFAWAGFVADPSGYLAPTLGALLLVALSGSLLRSLRTPTVLVLLAQLAVLALWFTHRWVPAEAWGGWWPTSGSLAEAGALLRQGAAAAQSYPAPVPESVPEILPLLVASGALVGVLVDLLACGLRRVPVAGLPLLAVYTAPVSILDGGVPWWVFAAGAVGFLALLVTDQARSLSLWGRPVSRTGTFVDSGAGTLPGISLRTSARRIGLTATSLAVVAPLVVPTLSLSLLPGSGPGGAGDGDQVSITNPMVGLRRDLARGRDVDLLTVQTENADPSYLRISVLDAFNGLTWKPSRRDIPSEQRAEGTLPDPPGLDGGIPRREVDLQITTEDAFDSAWLPTPYPVTSIDAPGDWRYDTDTFDFISAADGQTAGGLTYSLSALEVDASAEALLAGGASPEAIFTPNTEVPDDLPELVEELAREVTDGLGSKYEKAVQLQNWFRRDGDFSYSLNRGPTGNGNEDLVRFLTPGPEGRIGYCEQFAASMALMGRTLGIPSRVAVGFLEPQQVGQGRYVYSAWDLHAWPEMYFDGAGWVRFEPTPGTRAPSVPDYTTADVAAPEPSELPTTSEAPLSPEQADRDRLQGDAAPTGGEDGSSSGGTAVRTALVVLGLLALLLAPRLARAAVRRRRWSQALSAREAAEAGWRELRDTALDLRLGWDDTITLRTQARSLAAAFGPGRSKDVDEVARIRSRGAAANPDAAHALERVVRDVEQARYSRDTAGAHGRETDDVRADVELCADALYAGAMKKRRRSAVWLPASLVRNDAWRLRLPTRAHGGAAVPAEAGVDRVV
ncbi:MAG TPA: DUF3488 and transglutaminase-like domain-containing protein [Nocardioidaceae bacterium]